MAVVREAEPPLGPDADERPPREAWDAMWAQALTQPVPAYDGRPLIGVARPRRPEQERE